MQLQAIVYTPEMDSLIDWWTSVLGCGPDHRSEAWTTFGVGDATLALHTVESLPEGGRIALSLVSDRPLDVIVAEYQARGLSGVDEVVEQPFGRQLPLRDPHGNVVMINEHRS